MGVFIGIGVLLVGNVHIFCIQMWMKFMFFPALINFSADWSGNNRSSIEDKCFIQFISSSQAHVCLLLQVDKLLTLNSSCPLSHIILPSFGFLFLSLTHFFLIGWFPKLLALICSTTLSQKLSVSNSPPQYLFLTNTTSSVVNPAPSQHGFASASYPHTYQDPLLYTPPTAADIPVAQA